MPPKAALAKRRPRLGDLPARPILGLLALTPTRGERRSIALRPAGDGRVIVEAGSGAIVAALELEGELTRPIALPRAALARLRCRHPTAERLAIDGPSPGGTGMLRLSALDESSAATVLADEAVLVGELGDLLTAPPLQRLGEAQGVMLDPVLMAMAVEAMRRVCPGGPVEVSLSTHELLGMLVRGRPVDGDGVITAAIAVVRLLAVKGARP
jgi:hypothetical protein